MKRPFILVTLEIVLLNFFLQGTGLAQQQAFTSPAGTKFLLYTPPGYTSSTNTFPLLISLHSKGEVGDDLAELTSKNPEQMPSRLIHLNRWPKDLPFIVLTPQLKPTIENPDPQWPADYIDEVVRLVMQNYRVDTRKVYLTGISRGGTGVWTYASAYPDKIAAIVAISGRSDLSQACPVKNIPIWAFHGDGDTVAPPKFSIDMVNEINGCLPLGKYKPHLNILNAKTHNGWNEIYNGTNGYKIYEWLLMFEKNNLSNKTPYVNAGQDYRIHLRTEPVNLIGDFFDSDGTISSVVWTQTSGTALTLNNINSNYLKLTNLKTGLFEFVLTVTDNGGAITRDTVSLEIVNASGLPHITNLVLVNGKTNIDVGNLAEGQIIDKQLLGITEINIRANVSSDALSVKFSVNTDQNTRTVNTSGPLYLKPQSSGVEWKIESGDYLICATPYSKSTGTGTRGTSQCFKITVTEGAESCAGVGKITREVWNGITGKSISSIPVNSAPTSAIDISIFESPSNAGDNYGCRVRGYVCPPVTGNYTFFISSDDQSELWLSTNDNPNNKVKLASVIGSTAIRQWDKYTTQQSVLVNLVQGKRYYVEALHKEGTAYDHLSVGWQLPNAIYERPIPGTRLSPFQTTLSSSSLNDALLKSILSEEIKEPISLYPNPVSNRKFSVILRDEENAGEVLINILSASGEMIFSEFIQCEGSCNSFNIELKENLIPGIYLVSFKIKDEWHRRRLLIK